MLALGEEGDDGGMGDHQAAPGPGPRTDIGLPIPGLLRELELGHDHLEDAFEDGFLVLHMVVQGHGLDAELTPQASHGHGLQALLIHHLEGGAEDPFPGQRLAMAPGGGLPVALLGGEAHVLQMFNVLGHISSLSGLTPYIVRIDYLTP